MRLALALLLLATQTQAQWQIQQSNTTADLRGIHSLGNGVAWASGSKGTVLHTIDNGTTWQPCTIPPGAEALDFRGIQALDTQTAIVMSSGKGDLSRLYKTTNACATWQLLFTNPDPEGFWDALLYDESFDQTFILGDPVRDVFRLFVRQGDGVFHTYGVNADLRASKGQAAFAASNSILVRAGEFGSFGFVTGGARAEFVYETHGLDVKRGPVEGFSRANLPFQHTESAGAFSIATSIPHLPSAVMVAVGGDYRRSDDRNATAASTSDWGVTWRPASSSPHGYRSSVAYSPEAKTWITVGPNGTDVSTDDGRNWHPLNPTADESQHWNALSLPFVVGPHGRIGLLRPEALKP